MRGELILSSSCCQLSWTATMVNVDIDTTNEKGKQGRDLYFHMYVIAVVPVRRIPITNRLNVHALTKIVALMRHLPCHKRRSFQRDKQMTWSKVCQ